MEEVDWAHAVVGKTVQNIIEDNLWDNESRLRVFFTDGTEAAWGGSVLGRLQRSISGGFVSEI